MQLALWLLTIPLGAATPQDEAHDVLLAADDWSTLTAEWEDAVLEWGKAWIEGWRHDPGVRPATPPVAEFWDRFQQHADEGNTEALVWLLHKVDQTGDEDAVWRPRLRMLFETVRAGGGSDWVADCIPPLTRARAWLDEQELVAFLTDLSGANREEAVRRAALFGRAELARAEGDDARAFQLQLAAYQDPREADSPLPGVAVADLDEIAELVEDDLSDAGSAYFERWYLDVGDMYMHRPGAPPDAQSTYQPLLEGLAERGSARAALWCLDEIWPRDEATRERLRVYLTRVADVGIDEAALGRFAWSVSSLVHKVGAESAEPAVMKLAEGAEGETRARLLASLGEGLCGGSEEERARGLDLLREVVEAWPDSDPAAAARGKIFRYENLLVGQKVPDFEAEDAEGNAFRLSDYEGKVTVVDFWGFW